MKVTTLQELVDYLNRGKDRTEPPIEHLSLFSQGVPQVIAFGYQLTSDHNMTLNVLNYEQISPQAFARSAQVDSYACRTGMGNCSEFPIEDGMANNCAFAHQGTCLHSPVGLQEHLGVVRGASIG
ncbi:hypothetical protein [Pseudomonas xanthosomatis]|uniref:hypothetical protein n=1 Tax=Pseudomonas xanthosomatis TaxID=2842356 RepID=UPI003516AD0C